MSARSTNGEDAAVGMEFVDTVVIGAGQAGLAAAYELAARGVDFVLLTDEARIGDNWRRRWESLRLFTPSIYNGLPGMAFPAPGMHLPAKDEVADYLEKYAAHFRLPVRLNTRVTKVISSGSSFHVSAGGRQFEASSVIVATGAYQRPRIPAVAKLLAGTIEQLHSSEYLNPAALPDGPVLVVGAGNSGAQIALELAGSRKVWLAGRDTGHLPRRFLGRDIFQWVWPVMDRMHLDTALGRRMHGRSRRGDAVLGLPEGELQKAGVVRVGRVTGERDGLPVCADAVLEPRVIIWCTGYSPDFSYIDLPIHGDDGYPRHRRGIATDHDGLYFVGLRFQYRMNSSLIGGVRHDAAYIAEQASGRA